MFDDPEPRSSPDTGNLINADTADSEAGSLLPLKCHNIDKDYKILRTLYL